jgi:hypothetical protein
LDPGRCPTPQIRPPPRAALRRRPCACSQSRLASAYEAAGAGSRARDARRSIRRAARADCGDAGAANAARAPGGTTALGRLLRRRSPVCTRVPSADRRRICRGATCVLHRSPSSYVPDRGGRRDSRSLWHTHETCASWRQFAETGIPAATAVARFSLTAAPPFAPKRQNRAQAVGQPADQRLHTG